MIIAGPIPLDGVARPNDNGAGIIVRPALSDLHHRCRRASEMGDQSEDESQQGAVRPV